MKQQYTWSVKDRKFLSTVLFLHFSFVLMAISFFGLYYKGQVNDCKRLCRETGAWRLGKGRNWIKWNQKKKLESIRQSYEKTRHMMPMNINQ